MVRAGGSCILGFHMLFYILCALVLANAFTAKAAVQCEDDKELSLMCAKILNENLCRNETTGFGDFSRKNCPKTCGYCPLK